MPESSAISTRTKVLIAIGVVAAAIFISGRMIDIFWLKMVTKPIPVLMMALYLFLLPHKNRFNWLIIVGLLFGATGDILLEYSSHTFLFGLIAFLLGHIFYIIAFVSDCRRPALGVAVFVYLYGLAVYSVLQAGHLENMALPVMVYLLVITTMGWRAAARYQAPGVNHASAKSGMIGAALFLFSDTLLAISLFVAPFPLSGVIVIITYWLGQLGITAAAAYTLGSSSAQA